MGQVGEVERGRVLAAGVEPDEPDGADGAAEDLGQVEGVDEGEAGAEDGEGGVEGGGAEGDAGVFVGGGVDDGGVDGGGWGGERGVGGLLLLLRGEGRGCWWGRGHLSVSFEGLGGGTREGGDCGRWVCGIHGGVCGIGGG